MSLLSDQRSLKDEVLVVLGTAKTDGLRAQQMYADLKKRFSADAVDSVILGNLVDLEINSHAEFQNLQTFITYLMGKSNIERVVGPWMANSIVATITRHGKTPKREASKLFDDLKELVGIDVARKLVAEAFANLAVGQDLMTRSMLYKRAWKLTGVSEADEAFVSRRLTAAVGLGAGQNRDSRVCEPQKSLPSFKAQAYGDLRFS